MLRTAQKNAAENQSPSRKILSIFSKLSGKLNILKFFLHRNRVTKVRGWLQYIVPEYQNTLLLALFFAHAAKNLSRDGITEFEGGTIVEANSPSFSVFKPFGGYIDKVYRIYEIEI